MKKSMKLMSMLLAVALVVAVLPTAAFAAKTENVTQGDSSGVWTLEESETGETYAYNSTTGESVAKAYGYNEAGELVELDWDEYLWIKNSMPDAPVESLFSVGCEQVGDNFYSANADVATAYDYREVDVSTGKGTTIKLTADYVGPVTISYVEQVSVGASFGGSISLNATLKEIIRMGASFNWNVSAQTSTSAGGSYTVPSGKTAYVQFTPYMNVTKGDMYYITVAPGYYNESNLGEVWGKSPRKLATGLADGIYELAYK